MLDNITINMVVKVLLGLSAFLVAIDKIYDLYKKHNPTQKFEDADAEINVALTNIMNQINRHEDIIMNHAKLLGNDNEHLKRHDIQIADIQHKSEEDRYYNIRSFKVIIQKLSGNASDEELKKVYDELDGYERKSLQERLDKD